MKEIHLESIDSTNTYAKKWHHTFPKDAITCITADTQTAGKGQFQRKWLSPPGVNIYATFYFQLPANNKEVIYLAQLLSHSCASVLLQEGLKPEIKWPNDVLVGGKKIAGVLCEVEFPGTHVDVFLGIGLNVNMDQTVLDTIDQPATSLLAATGRRFDVKWVLQQLQNRFEQDLQFFTQNGWAAFTLYWASQKD